MADEETREEEGSNGNGNVVELSRTELEEMIGRAAEEAAAPLRQELEATRNESAELRTSAHEARVREQARQLQDNGHSTAVVTRAAEIMLADTGGAELTLSRRLDDNSVEDYTVSPTDIVLSILEVVRTEDMNLTQRQPATKPRQEPHKRQEDDKPTDEQAQEILDELRSTAVMISGIS